jgi:purine-nucleoside phosphorylase
MSGPISIDRRVAGRGGLVETAKVVEKNAVRASAAIDDELVGRGRRGERPARPADDEGLWRQAYDEAIKQGAGANVARVYANQTVAYERAEREGVELLGSRSYQAYR